MRLSLDNGLGSIATLSAGVGYDPSLLFANGEVGSWLLPGTAYGAMYQERTGVSATTPSGVDGPVGTYHCLITNRYYTAPSDSARPIYRSSGGLSWLEFDGLDDVLESAAIALPQTWSAAAVVLFANLTAANNVIDGDRGSGNNRYAQVLRRNLTSVQTIAFDSARNAFSDSFGTVGTSVPHILQSNRGASSIEGWLDGVSDGSTATTGTPASYTDTIRFGASRTLAGQNLTGFLSGRMYGALFLGRGYAANERQDVKSFLAKKAGV